MKAIIHSLRFIYQYATILVAVFTPIFFIPKTSFGGDVTYYIVVLLLSAVALISYVIYASLTRTWHSVSRLEFITYFAFSFAVLLSVVFSKDMKTLFLGEAFNQFSGAALLTLPVVMYLVRTLPENLRHKLKLIIVAMLSFISCAFVAALIFGGNAVGIARFLFSSFSNSISFASYLGLFSVALFFYVKKGSTPKKWKAFILITGLLFVSWALTLSSQNSVRPNAKSTMLVGKQALVNDGIFGVGPGNFSRAWQLYRPQDVIQSAYFGYDFTQGSGTVSTFFVTIGIVGVIAFLMLVLSALYSTWMSYRQNREGREHIILGLLLLSLCYFTGVAFFSPLSYSLLVLWMVLAGLGVAKAHLTEFHPSKKLAYLFVPVAFLLGVNAFVLVEKTVAFSIFNAAAQATTASQVDAGIAKAISVYPYDGFYRALIENAITTNRSLLSSQSDDKETLKNKYLKTTQAAVEAGISAVKSNPNNYQNYVSLGRAYELFVPVDKDGGFSNAKKSYQEAIKLYPENPYLYLMLARLETSAGTKEGVRTQLTEALKKKQNFADALYLMSQLEASDSKIEEALAYAIEAVKSAPNDPATYVQAGLLFYGKKDYPNAVAAFKAGLEKDQNNANIAYFLALSLRDGGEPLLAKPLADELLRRNPGNADLEKFIASLTPQGAVSSETKKAPLKK